MLTKIQITIKCDPNWATSLISFIRSFFSHQAALSIAILIALSSLSSLVQIVDHQYTLSTEHQQ